METAVRTTRKQYAYLGSRTTRERQARGDGISVYEVDTASGALECVQVVSGVVNPSYLAVSEDGRFLYTVHGDESDISAYAIDGERGTLSFINRQATGGRNPVHLALDPSGRFVVVSNHSSSSVAVLPLSADGAIGERVQLVPLEGPVGPHRVEQQHAKPHANPFDPSGRFVLVPDKGLDRIFSFRFDGGQLTPCVRPFVASREGAGPRHLAFHPSLPMAYVVNELDSTVTTYRFDSANGSLAPLQILSALPASFTGNSRAAAIAVAADGRVLYSSNRGADSIAVFRIDQQTGLLEFLAADSSGGRTPRSFTVSPDGRRLYALNEDSDAITVFAVDAVTGRLTATGAVANAGSPVCMVFGKVPA